MATWKKIIVSGSGVSQLANDSNYVALGDASVYLTGSFSGSFTGDGSALTGVTADAIAYTAITGKPTLLSGSAQIASDISGSFTAASASIATAIDAVEADLATASGSLATRITAQEAFSSSLDDTFATDADITRLQTSASLATASIAANETTITLHTTQISVATASIAANEADIATLNDTVVFSSDTGSHVTGVVAGGTSYTLDVTDGTGATSTISIPVAGGLISSSVEGDAQGQIKLNGVNVDVNDLGSGDSPQFAGLTVTGDLTVGGDQVNLNVTNLAVEDQFILLNSGSTTADAGLIFGGADGAANTGVGLIWDFDYNSNDGRLAIVNSLAAGATGAQTPSYYIAGAFVGTAGDAATAQADHAGNIRVEGGDIYIYDNA